MGEVGGNTGEKETKMKWLENRRIARDNICKNKGRRKGMLAGGKPKETRICCIGEGGRKVECISAFR